MTAARTCGFVAATGFALVALGAVPTPDASGSEGAPAIASAVHVAVAVRGLSLRGTIIFTDARWSEALVDLGGGDLRRVRIGGVLGQWGEVTGIERDRILIRRGGREYEFTFNESELGGAGVLLAGSAVPGGNAEGAGPEGVPESVLIRERHARNEQPPDVDPGPPLEMDETDWNAAAADAKSRADR